MQLSKIIQPYSTISPLDLQALVDDAFKSSFTLNPVLHPSLRSQHSSSDVTFIYLCLINDKIYQKQKETLEKETEEYKKLLIRKKLPRSRSEEYFRRGLAEIVELRLQEILGININNECLCSNSQMIVFASYNNVNTGLLMPIPTLSERVSTLKPDEFRLVQGPSFVRLFRRLLGDEFIGLQYDKLIPIEEYLNSSLITVS